jgi:predicted transcriptional regulator
MKKQKVIQTVNEFSQDINLNELFERLIVADKIDKGLEQIEKGQTVSHDKVVAHFRKKWQK